MEPIAWFWWNSAQSCTYELSMHLYMIQTRHEPLSSAKPVDFMNVRNGMLRFVWFNEKNVLVRNWTCDDSGYLLWHVYQVRKLFSIFQTSQEKCHVNCFSDVTLAPDPIGWVWFQLPLISSIPHLKILIPVLLWPEMLRLVFQSKKVTQMKEKSS